MTQYTTHAHPLLTPLSLILLGGGLLATILIVLQLLYMARQPALLAGNGILLAHSMVALIASVLTAWMLLATKGTRVHRWAGRAWSAMLVFIALSSFALRDGIGASLGGPFGLGPIHLLSILTLYNVWIGIRAIRRGNRRLHVSAMVGTCWGLLIAGAFTFLPGRFIHQLAFGAL